MGPEYNRRRYGWVGSDQSKFAVSRRGAFVLSRRSASFATGHDTELRASPTISPSRCDTSKQVERAISGGGTTMLSCRYSFDSLWQFKRVQVPPVVHGITVTRCEHHDVLKHIVKQSDIDVEVKDVEFTASRVSKFSKSKAKHPLSCVRLWLG